jgi:MFS family permease
MISTPYKPTKWTFLFLMLSAMMILMGGAAVAPALPLIGEAFPGASEASITFIVTLPALAIAITGILVGYLSDRFGKISILAASVAIFTIAGSSGFYLTSLYEILVGRFILGIGIAGIICTTSALIVCYYDGLARTRVLGYQAAAMGVGVLILETSGGLLASVSWRATFLIYLIGVVIFAGVLLTMKEPARQNNEEQSRQTGEAQREFSGKTFPLIPLLFGYAALFFGNMLFFLLPTRFPFLMANMDTAMILGDNTALLSGLFLGVMGCSSALIGLFYGRIAYKVSWHTLLTIAFAFFGVGLCSLGVARSLVVVAIAVILVGLGEGILMPTIVNHIASITPKQFLGRAMGGFSVFLNLGQFMSTFAIIPVIAIVATYSNLFLVFGVVAFVLALPFLFTSIRKRPEKPQMSHH